MSKKCLVVAGEPSGDLIGQFVVQSLVDLGWKVEGSGGPLMQNAGLHPLVDFEPLAVSGVGDVLGGAVGLGRSLRRLQRALTSGQYQALFCIDYPGFNLRLMARAQAQNLPVYWLAPPQAWAWKANRARLFHQVPVGVFFEFEKAIYAQAGALVSLVAHPLRPSRLPSGQSSTPRPRRWGIFLGSRAPQVRRNLAWGLRTAQLWESQGKEVVIVAPNPHLHRYLQRHFAPSLVQLRSAVKLSQLAAAFCPPGTITLDLACHGVPFAVLNRVDWLTYFAGKKHLRLPYLALPSLILKRSVAPEHYFCWPQQPRLALLQQLTSRLAQPSPNLISALHHALSGSSISAWVRGMFAV